VTIEIPLTRGYVALVDDADAALILGMGKWHAGTSGGGRIYARKALPRDGGRKRLIFLHTALTGVLGIDHINGDSLDNRRANLRPATPLQNMRNTRRRSDNTSGYKGVSWDQHRSAWAAYIRITGRRQFLGRYGDLADAARAYDAAARQHFGEFAVINFPGDNR
jgi:hypothetical protein